MQNSGEDENVKSSATEFLEHIDVLDPSTQEVFWKLVFSLFSFKRLQTYSSWRASSIILSSRADVRGLSSVDVRGFMPFEWFELRKLTGDGGPSLPEADREQVLLVVPRHL
jgi:hypothetical protein